ncbi:MAG: response regulator [Verrucomicrobia subdivision 3 bacterium]|nr:response regulator [Limisphaerales bacterium]
MKKYEYETTFHRGQPLKVLIVEDTPSDAELCLLTLRRAGYSAHADIVASREEFVARIEAEDYDLVLADYHLPGWTGAQALTILQERGKETPFILVTGHIGDEAALDVISKGADDYVLKDRLSRLPLAVRRVMREQRLMRERRQAAMEKERLIAQLREAAEEVKRLNGMLPICMGCKKILDAKGRWHRIEIFIQKHSRGQVSPCLCPECSQNLYPEYIKPRERHSPRRGEHC